MTDKSLVVQTLLAFFFFSGQQKKQVRKTRQIKTNLKDSKEEKETGNGLAEKKGAGGCFTGDVFNNNNSNSNNNNNN